ncbi:hypothetical protein BC834DRAFT_58472 [Gloeopeniophorella convolvens]|nr:hypothetical protein BC834DRAFT_58472 [Gloeopeniophorella convolvens]
MGDLISSIAWVKRGVAARHPSKQSLNGADIERIKAIANLKLEDARTELERVRKRRGTGYGPERRR